MSTSAQPSTAQGSASTLLITHDALKIAQAASTVVPPAYLVSSLILRRGPGFSLTRWMKASINGVMIGAAAGGALGFARTSGQSAAELQAKYDRIASDAMQVRSDDYSVIGATISALLTPAIFLRRASIIYLVAGGASIGLGAGVWAHLAQTWQEGQSAPTIENVVDQVKDEVKDVTERK